MNIEANWRGIRRICTRALGSSFHCAIATVTPEGLPHVTPIGSLVLGEPGHAIYFEAFTQRMTRNFEKNQSVCVLAVRSGLLFWLSSLIRGRFNAPPAIRLHGLVGRSRDATDDEIAQWRRRVRRLRLSKGYERIWANMRTVRDVTFTKADAIHIGEMTRECWACFDNHDAKVRV